MHITTFVEVKTTILFKFRKVNFLVISKVHVISVHETMLTTNYLSLNLSKFKDEINFLQSFVNMDTK